MTSLSPVLIIIYIIGLTDNWSYEKLKNLNSIYELFLKDWHFLTILIILFFICTKLINFSKKNLEKFKINIASIKTANKDTLSFLFAYLLPLVIRPSSGINTGMLIIFFLTFSLIAYSSHSYHFNPLFGIIGYRCYEVTEENGMCYTILTKKDIKSCKDIKSIVHITDYMVLES